MKKLSICAYISIATLILASASWAGYLSTLPVGVSNDTAVMIVWQNQAGYWWAGGPVQCLWSGEESKEDAVEYVYDEKRDSPTYVGTIGKYTIYSFGRKLVSSDTDARICVKDGDEGVSSTKPAETEKSRTVTGDPFQYKDSVPPSSFYPPGFKR